MLPIKNTDLQYKTVELPESKKVISARRYLTKEIRMYLQNIQSVKTPSDQMDEVFKLMKNCVDPKDIETIEKASKADFTYFMMWLRSVSVDAKIPYPHSCPHCQFYYPDYIYDYSLEGSYKLIVSEVKEVVLSDETIIYLKKLSIRDEQEILKKLDPKSTPSKVIFEKVKKSIDKIVEMNNIFDNWSDEELTNYIDSFPLDDYKKLVTGYLGNISEISLEKKQKCLSCEQTYTIKLEESDFFV